MRCHACCISSRRISGALLRTFVRSDTLDATMCCHSRLGAMRAVGLTPANSLGSSPVEIAKGLRRSFQYSGDRNSRHGLVRGHRLCDLSRAQVHDEAALRALKARCLNNTVSVCTQSNLVSQPEPLAFLTHVSDEAERLAEQATPPNGRTAPDGGGIDYGNTVISAGSLITLRFASYGSHR